MSGNIFIKTQLANTVLAAAVGYIVDLRGAHDWSVEVAAVIDSSAKTAVDNKQAALNIGTTITYTATTAYLGAAGNAITIAYTGGGSAGSEVVTVVGTAISVQIASGVSTGNQVKTAVLASAPATALVTTTGTAAGAQTTVGATNLTGGVTSKFNLVLDTISISSHGYYTGLVVQATTSSGSLPAGLSTSTNYFVVVIDPNTIKLATTLALALAGTPDVDITAYGTDGSTITLTPTAVSGLSYKLQKSNSYDPQMNPSPTWIDLVAGETNSVVTNTISSTATSAASGKQVGYSYGRILFAISAGTVQVVITAAASKG